MVFIGYIKASKSKTNTSESKKTESKSKVTVFTSAINIEKINFSTAFDADTGSKYKYILVVLDNKYVTEISVDINKDSNDKTEENTEFLSKVSEFIIECYNSMGFNLIDTSEKSVNQVSSVLPIDSSKVKYNINLNWRKDMKISEAIKMNENHQTGIEFNGSNMDEDVPCYDVKLSVEFDVLSI